MCYKNNILIHCLTKNAIVLKIEKKKTHFLLLASLDLLQYVVELGYEVIGVVDAERHRWLELEDVVVRTLTAHNDLFLLHTVDDVLRLGDGGRALLAVEHELDADEEAGAAHVADYRPALRELLQLGHEVVADLQRALLKILALDHLHHSVGDRAGDWVASVLERKFRSILKTTCLKWLTLYSMIYFYHLSHE